jgi:hypothetical protein
MHRFCPASVRNTVAGPFAVLAVVGLCALSCTSARAQVTVYSNDFETNANGFTNTARSVLTTDTSGAGATSSTFLGRFANDTTSLNLTGLTPGVVHTLEFDLYIGATMDGGEPISLTFGPTTLINTTFSNFFNQAYSDTTFLNPAAIVHAPFTGADVARTTAPSNTDRFSIYFFSRGAGNPVITFTPTLSTATLTFQGTSMQDVSDEFWALDNVRVTVPAAANAAPEPGTLALLALTVGGYGLRAAARRRRRK